MTTKIAIFSDIHSNLWALDAVLKDAKHKQVTAMVNLGDILYGPLAPQATFERLQSENIITIKGNQDRQIYEAQIADIECNKTLQFILSDLSQEALTWMEQLPATLSIHNEIFLCHGTPSSDLIYLLEDITSGTAQLKSDAGITQHLHTIQEPIILCGHTHTPRAVKLNTGQLVINPGSVGLPAYYDDEPIPHKIENGSPLASYCILEKEMDSWQVEFIRVPYNYNYAAQLAEDRERNDWSHALKTGRVLK